MTRLEALRELAAKVEAGASRLDVLQATAGADIMFGHAGRYVYAIDAYEGSLDAAQALHEAVLPEYMAEIDMDGTARVEHRGAWPWKPFIAESATPARAWLLAILRALIEQEAET